MDTTLVLYDGVCGFCNATIQFLLARDPEGAFKYAPLQSDLAKQALARHAVTVEDLDTVYVIAKYGTTDEQVLSRSTAALHCAGRLGFPWSLGRVALAIPRVIRDGVYDFIAKHRYKIFGKLDACMRPDPKVRERFLG